MLKLKYLFENFALAKECIRFYEYNEETLDEMLPFFRISSNAIYPFRAGENAQKVCFLRISPIEEKSFEDVVTEISLIEWLIEKGFSAMKPVPMKDGEWVKQVTTEWGKYNVSCFEKVPGESLEDVPGTLDIVRALDALDEIVEEDTLKVAEQSFMEGYQSATDFTEEQYGSLPLMRRLVRLQEYATLLHVMSEPMVEMPDWMYGLTDKLKYKLSSLENQMS